jgi:hypothetical protein
MQGIDGDGAAFEPLLRFILDIRYWQRIQRVAYAGTTNGVKRPTLIK